MSYYDVYKATPDEITTAVVWTCCVCVLPTNILRLNGLNQLQQAILT